MSELPPSVDLTDCDREPIHIPGSIQPHGILLAVDPATLSILQAAGETKRLAGRDIGQLLNEDAKEALGADAASLIRSSSHLDLSEPLYLGSFSVPTDPDQRLDVIAHRRDGVLILELEPSTPKPLTAAQLLADVRQISTALAAAPDLNSVLQVASREVRRLIGFDRVMVYRFLEDGAGSVVAEDKIDELDTFLNHHYPASDIPKQARALYLQNLVRVIPDVGYMPAPLAPELNPVTGNPLDMSDCALRSVSPIHLQYLKNMGVAASMSVSIVVDGVLWGLIACHHTSSRLVPYELRESCKHVGQILSQQVKARGEAEFHRQEMHLKTARDDLLGTLARAPSVERGLHDHLDEIREFVSGDGAAILYGVTVTRVGRTPPEAQTRELAGWLLNSSPSGRTSTNSLVRRYEPAQAFAAEASGLLAAVVSRETPIVLMWFRAEHVETINWAGNPHKPVEAGAEPGALTPRKSFEVWKETVRHQSRSWSTAEIEGARRFVRAIADLRQHNAVEELNVQLRRMLSEKEALLTQKNLLMQEVNHRVQNSLQLVNSMLNLQARQSSDTQVKAQFEEASRRIMAISTVHRRLWRSDHIQSVDFGSYLEELRDGLLEAWGSAWAGHIKVHAGHVLVPTNQAVVLALVLTELLTNAVKYAYAGQPGPVEVTVRRDGQRTLRLTVRDHGTGMPENAPTDGLGSRLIRSPSAQLGGDLEVRTHLPGTSVTLTVSLGADLDMH